MTENKPYTQNDHEEFTVYIFNAKDDLRFSVMKNCFDLSDTDVYQTISEEFKILKQRLSFKGVSYESMKGALLPNQDKGKFETCFIFDSAQIEDNCYGDMIFSKLLPLLDKDSVYSVLCGDYIDILSNISDSQLCLRSAMNDVIARCQKTRFQHSSQYFLVYFNRLTGSQRWRIVEELMKYPWFTGFADLTRHSLFKTYISCVLTQAFVKCRNQIIASHQTDYSDDENVNMLGYPFEENGYRFISINEDSFSPFLCYKIEADVSDETDIGFSFNTLFPKFNSVDKLKLKIDDKKWNDYLMDESKKGPILSTLGYDIEDKETFIREIYKKICSSYIYKLERKLYDEKWVWKFCVCVDMPTVNGSYRKTTVVLRYFPDIGEVHVITIT
ncbi:hypothetical protein [Candidatus Soleaferrea massiliensis]|uniref:hypothetical protein n=1 Tax=Candidatus Soleaferrea massiliensis TaxID=1470354 RepID=UPI00058CFDAD|nr:hypothetical protein [Candidatus Soleaferrea massiliensis]